jgi:N-acetylmuramoyl-L-alanine amidase
MSANPTRLADPESPHAADPGFPLQEGNRVLESLAQREAVHALLAFSALHEQIRSRQTLGSEPGSDWDLFQTERFVLDEILQLICDRAQTITQAEGIIVAFAEGHAMVCRAASGPLVAARGDRVPESEFLQDCVDSGRILRCDDCDVDGRVELDLSCELGARSTVLVPLRGRRSRLGMLQAFSKTPFAFSDDDIRCLDLFAELILSALQPEDQDRRLNWLAEVADEILNPKLAAAAVVESEETTVTAENVETVAVEAPDVLEPISGGPIAQVADPIEELPTRDFAFEAPSGDFERDPLPFLASLNVPSNSRPGLNFVLILIAAAALFATGVWWGMRDHRAAVANATDSPAQVSPAVEASKALVAADNLLDPTKLDSEPFQATPASASKLAAMPKITGVRHWSSQVGSTVVIDMQDQVPYEVHRLASPERIYFDLHDTGLAAELEGRTIEIGDPSLKRVRVAQPVSGVTRIVLDTKDGSNFSVSMESSPYRLVVQLRGSERPETPTRTDLTASGARSQASKAALSPLPLKPEDDQLRAKTGRFRIVLDAGHGGWDLGTVGRRGLLEKDLVLDVTQRLGKLLQNRLGAEVAFTRTNDAYLPLDQRAEFANQAQADLFVSVHANYSNLATARGVETYYTNRFSAPGTREIEKQDNTTSLQPTLVKLSAGELHEKIEESRRLAASVQKSLYAKLAANSAGIRDRGIKDSAFVVLTGTTMPSILTEISFVSSPADERNLQSATYRQQIAEALYKGIAHYEAGSHRVKMAQVRQNTPHNVEKASAF